MKKPENKQVLKITAMMIYALLLLLSCSPDYLQDELSEEKPDQAEEFNAARSSINSRRHLLEIFDSFAGDKLHKMTIDTIKAPCTREIKLPSSFWKTGAQVFFACYELRWYIPEGRTEFKIPENGYLMVEANHNLDADFLRYFDGLEIAEQEYPEKILGRIPEKTCRALILRKLKLNSGAIASINKLSSLHWLCMQELSSDSFYNLNLKKISYLDLRYLDARIIETLLNSACNLQLLTLKDLALSQSMLASISAIRELKELRLNATDIDDSGLCRIIAGKSLTRLELHGTEISDAALLCLNSQNDLEVLNLSRCSRITDAGLKALCACTQLKTLDIAHSEVGDRGLAAISCLHKLETLNIAASNCSPACFADLKKFTQLKDLNLEDMKVSVKELRSLQQSLKDCRIR